MLGDLLKKLPFGVYETPVYTEKCMRVPRVAQIGKKWEAFRKYVPNKTPNAYICAYLIALQDGRQSWEIPEVALGERYPFARCKMRIHNRTE